MLEDRELLSMSTRDKAWTALLYIWAATVTVGSVVGIIHVVS